MKANEKTYYVISWEHPDGATEMYGTFLNIRSACNKAYRILKKDQETKSSLSVWQESEGCHYDPFLKATEWEIIVGYCSRFHKKRAKAVLVHHEIRRDWDTHICHDCANLIAIRQSEKRGERPCTN